MNFLIFIMLFVAGALAANPPADYPQDVQFLVEEHETRPTEALAMLMAEIKLAEMELEQAKRDNKKVFENK